MSDMHPAWRAHGVRSAIEVAHDMERELREAREEIALMREEIESQERAHAAELERWRKLYEYQQRAHAPEVSRWRTAALQYAAMLARLGHKVTLPDVPVQN